ncbi:site-specfic recombinase, phage integrase family protein [Roseobacter sp. AzwK-3b]|uniref:tyrosine-type recombinase/integrase n=1 Tax=Roseobacter sp. AzwK-3b TaxID=351016 RepID=UPI0001568B0E|nr:integrase arm-type DNA-binding domain-containing protein [Roseobacter sp. AzwK-3b]EDM70692.1 site-specfic recombinase, phage integrase family protein [Roseobacter sp. AzwK-3b]
MPSLPLSSDVAIRKWRPSKDGEARSTGGRDGLYIRGWRSGSKVFYFRTETWLKIGEYPNTSLAKARELAIVAKRLKKEGFGKAALVRGFANAKTASDLDGIVRGEILSGLASGELVRVLTYDEMWQQWFADVEPTLQAGPSRRRPRAIHEQHVSPVIGTRPLTEIRRREIFDLLAPLFRSIPVTAGHALGHINKVFELAIVKELCEANPTPPRASFPKRITKKKHHGTLPASKMPELWEWLQTTNTSEALKAAVLTAMVTGHRISVIVNAEWAHIDMQTGVWTVPERDDKSTQGRMKSGRAYSLRLPQALLDKILSLKPQEDDSHAAKTKYVFASPMGRGGLTPNAVLKSLKRFDPSLTTHGFRNAIKEFCRITDPPIPDHIADAFCDHSLKGLDASYRRRDTSEERAQLAERLMAYVTAKSSLE